MDIRLDKWIADAALCSRREARAIAAAGRVTVNGTAVTAPDTKVDPARDEVLMDGQRLDWSAHKYILMDKPAGVLSATTDKSQPTVLDLLPAQYKKLALAPVGRLDKDTTGLLILTDDGDFAHRVISPKSDVKKVYAAETDGTPDQADICAFRQGLVLGDGTRCLPAELEILGENRCRVTVREGKYHQVKRMLAAVGKPVLALRRISIGLLHIDEKLGPGGFREMTAQEIKDVLTDNNALK